MKRVAGPACVALGAGGLSMGFYLAYLQWWVHPELTRPEFFWAYWPLWLTEVLLWATALLCFEVAVRRVPA